MVLERKYYKYSKFSTRKPEVQLQGSQIGDKSRITLFALLRESAYLCIHAASAAAVFVMSMETDAKSPKEHLVESKLKEIVNEIVKVKGDDLPVRLLNIILANSEIQAIQDYANIVSITRLGFNDHGPVHMKTVCRNALKILLILHKAGIKTNLEMENAGTFTDSVCAVMLAAMLHDSGMTVGRKNHELYSGIITYNLIDNILKELLPAEEEIRRRVTIRSLALEGIIGHMGTNPIHSIEAGIILIADGCDMTKGRARISLERPSRPAEGDIHKYSANSIEKVLISHGAERPVKIEVLMKAEVGFFQVEEVLIPKILSSPAKEFIELYAGVEGEEMKRYR